MPIAHEPTCVNVRDGSNGLRPERAQNQGESAANWSCGNSASFLSWVRGWISTPKPFRGTNTLWNARSGYKFR